MDNNVLMFCMMLVSMSQNIFMVLGPYVMFIISLFFKIRLYRFTSEELCNYIRNNIKKDFCYSYTEHGEPFGCIIHRNYMPKYVCFVSNPIFDRHITLICDESMKKHLISNPKKEILDVKIEESDTEESPKIYYYTRGGNYEYLYYIMREIEIDKTYSKEQKQISRKIITLYEKQNFLTCYLYGKTGTGKTMLAYLIAKELKCSICDNYNPMEPGDLFANLYSKVSPNANRPIILLIDEIDILLKKIHDQTVDRHKKVPTQIYDKASWNAFFDKIDMGLYPYVIVMLCSNKTKREMDRLDDSYLREGRTHLNFELKEKIEKNVLKED